MIVLLCLAFFWYSQYNIIRWEESGAMSLNNSDKPVKHYERPYINSKFASASLKYLFINAYNAASIRLGYKSN